MGVDCWSVVGVAHVLGSCWLLPASICKMHMSPLFFRHGHVALVVGVVGVGGVVVVVGVVVFLLFLLLRLMQLVLWCSCCCCLYYWCCCLCSGVLWAGSSLLRQSSPQCT